MGRNMIAGMRRARRLMQPPGLRTLGTVLKQLRLGKTAMLGGATNSAVAPKALRMRKGARYVARTHRSAAGSRAYKIYLPASNPLRPKGLILMLHGCNQTPDDFALGTHMNTEAEKHGIAVVYPEQTAGDNSAACWNWFRPGDQDRGAGEPAELASLMRKLTRDFGLKRGMVFVAGLSAGGAMAAILADVYPDVFSAAGVHSGLARGAANNALSAVTAMRSGGRNGPSAVQTDDPDRAVRRIVFQGDADGTVHASNAAMIVAAALGDHAQPSHVVERTVRGRGYSRSDFLAPDGSVRLQLWMLKGADHAWSGGRAGGSCTDPYGPDATSLMVRFFLSDPLRL